MLYDKYTSEQEAIERSDEYRKENRMIIQIKLQCPQAHIKAETIEHLYERPAGARHLIFFELLVPVFEICEYLLCVERICHPYVKLSRENSQ